MLITPAALGVVFGRPVNDNMRSTIRGVMARPLQLAPPHRLYMFVGQIALESGLWHYDRELWGKTPTPAQARYDIRMDLGNTPERDGDGYRYRGRSGIQMTGKDHYIEFTAWAKANYPGAPDFVAQPDLVNTDPWEGLVSVWFWETNGLSAIADTGDIQAVSKRVNGGYNGLNERILYTVQFGMFLSGSGSIRAFQRDHKLNVDGVVGPITKATLHRVLTNCPPVLFALT